MVTDPRRPKKKAKQPGKLKYFFLKVEGHKEPLLHRTLHINRGQDIITTWCYPLAKRVAYSYSYTKKQRETAFTTKQVMELLNRGRRALERGIANGGFEEPPYTYGLDENRNKRAWMWHEKNIMEAHAYLSNLHYGNPRKDGKITPWPALPTVRELRAMIRQETILYVKNEDGEFVPAWRAPDFS